MKVIKPIFYDEFNCKAGNCEDSCCTAGWQIDVDKKTMQKYSLSNDPLVKDISKKIVKQDGSYCIKCENMGICPFFRKDRLCDVVVKKGQGFLSDVCRTFPRIYNYVDDRLELGLSFTCEEVVSLVFKKQKITFEYQNVKKEILLNDKDFATREKYISYIQDENLGFAQKLDFLIGECEYSSAQFDNIREAIKNCEWLKNDLSKLNFEGHIKGIGTNFCLTDKQLENILVCFLFRYLINSEYKFSLNSKLRFCIFSVLFCDYIATINKQKNDNSFDINAVKEYSREIESSSKNVKILFNFFNF